MLERVIKEFTWAMVYDRIERIVEEVNRRKEKYVAILAVKNGGVIPGYIIWGRLSARRPKLAFESIDAHFCSETLKKYAGKHIMIVDDIHDTGATMKIIYAEVAKYGVRADMRVLTYREDHEPADWLHFPWESCEDTAGGMKQAVMTLIRGMGEDPKREGLLETPRRVESMWKELTSGYQHCPKKILSTTFSKENYDEMIVVKDIKFFSTCEHHMLPFYGVVHFAYIPDKNVVGLSKVHRLVECFSRRLQIQERMTMEIGTTFEKIVNPRGVAVVVEGVHLCTMVRGVKKENSKMITSYLGGVFRKELPTRQEFFSIINREK